MVGYFGPGTNLESLDAKGQTRSVALQALAPTEREQTTGAIPRLVSTSVARARRACAELSPGGVKSPDSPLALIAWDRPELTGACSTNRDQPHGPGKCAWR